MSLVINAIGVNGKQTETERFKKNVKVRAEAQKVKAGDEVSGP